MTWHVDPSMLVRYVDGELGDASVMSIEAHLLTCAECRAALPTVIDPARLDRMWTGVRDAIDAPRPRALERLLARVGVADHVARLLVTTASLQLSWIVSLVVSLAFAVAASRWFGGGNLPFLVVAPLVPVLGIAWSFRRPLDPLWEIGRATPTGGLRLTLIRCVAVLATSLMASGIICLALPRSGWAAVGWLLPALGLTVLTLALSTNRITIEATAVGVGTVWVLVVVSAAKARSDPLAAFGAGGQMVAGAVTLTSMLFLVARKDAFERQAASQGGWG
jgi:Putative zinc-finger